MRQLPKVKFLSELCERRQPFVDNRRVCWGVDGVLETVPYTPAFGVTGDDDWQSLVHATPSIEDIAYHVRLRVPQRRI